MIYDTKKKVNDLAYSIIGCAIEVHKYLGTGLMESIYEKCLAEELRLNGLQVQLQKTIPVTYKGMDLDCDLRYDILVENTIVVEIKSVETLLPIHQAQIITYINLMKKPKGLLINFKTMNISSSLMAFVGAEYSRLKDS